MIECHYCGKPATVGVGTKAACAEHVDIASTPPVTMGDLAKALALLARCYGALDVIGAAAPDVLYAAGYHQYKSHYDTIYWADSPEGPGDVRVKRNTT